MIKVIDAQKRFGPTLAVDHVSFEVKAGEVLGFLGPNGAGKSTTMRMITGYIPLSGGKIEVGNCDIEEDPIGCKKQIGYLPENAPSYPEMTVVGFLNFVAEIRGYHGLEKQKRMEEAIKTCHLEHVRKQIIDTLSKGFKHRVCFAQAILHNPDVLILDEPTDGLDPNQKHEMRELIKEMGKTKAIIVSTHILEEVEAICTRVIIIDQGKLVFNGTPMNLLAQSPEFGRVQIRIHCVGFKKIKSRLCEEDFVKDIRKVSEVDNSCEVLVIPEKDKREGLAGQLSKIMAEQNWSFDELHTDCGRLEEVFRSITSLDSAKEVA